MKERGKKMENIKMSYFHEDNGEKISIDSFREEPNDEVFDGEEICEMFLSFMKSIGYTKDYVCKHFRELNT